ncbi:acetylxylan esterase [Enterococcus sp. JM9B]|uniref:acetylxylan esterase n=1 Tax=Enterococcus sp. JM9B TaxID=1857216 RepID=UPI00137522C9|nr:acetylxylan esterase [Enterococcus sp. JM9B]KAF1301882.1 acetylesterase [Enterococcus sp. JM9B]
MYAQDAIAKWGSYLGSKSKPVDYELFWNKGISEVNELGIDYQLVLRDFQSRIVDFFDLFFTGVGGASVHCQVVRPKDNKQKYPVLFQFHGYHGDAGNWGDKVGWAAEGFIVICLDVRGQGGLSEDVTRTKGGTVKGHIIRGIEEGPENLLFRSVFLDIYQLTQIVFNMPDVDKEHVYVYGGSQGGAQALVAAAFDSRIKKAFVLYPFLSDYREAFRLNVLESAYEELAYWFRFRDVSHEKEEDFFRALDYIDIQYIAPKIKADVLWGMGLNDQACHPKTQFATYNNLVCRKKLLLYPEYGHESIPQFGDRMRNEILSAIQ